MSKKMWESSKHCSYFPFGNRKNNFYFNQVTYEKTDKRLGNLDMKNAFQVRDNATSIIKENFYLFVWKTITT